MSTLSEVLRGHVQCGDRYCSTFDGGNEMCGDCEADVARAADVVTAWLGTDAGQEAVRALGKAWRNE